MGKTSKLFWDNTYIKMEKLKELSVFFPAYNEEENIRRTVERSRQVLKKYAKKWEIIVVDDGSKDKTAEIIKEMASKDKRIKLVSHKKNRGYGAAVRSGFKNCRYEWMVFTDSDGQFDFSELPSFISTQKKTGADLVIGYYKKRRVSPIRKLNTGFWQFLVRILLGLKVRDIDCGFKLIRKEVIDSMKLTSERGAFISTEFLVKAQKKGYKIVEIPVTHYAREDGIPTGANFNVIISSFKDLYNFKKKDFPKFGRNLFFFFIAGIISTLISLGIFNVFYKIVNWNFHFSLIISIFIALIFNFIMNRNISFSAKGSGIKGQVWRYSLVSGAAIFTKFFISSLVELVFGGGILWANIAVLTGIVASVPVSFFGLLLWVFKNRKI